MWLENNISSEKIEPPVTSEYTEVFGEKDSEQKEVKRKKSKSQEKYKKTDDDTKHRKSKKSKSKKEKKSADYEETAGISTPSKEIIPDLRYNFDNSEESTTLVQPLTSYEELAKNKMVSIVYELKQIPHESNKLVASILITNNCQKLIKELVFDVSDTPSLRLMRNVSWIKQF